MNSKTQTQDSQSQQVNKSRNWWEECIVLDLPTLLILCIGIVGVVLVSNPSILATVLTVVFVVSAYVGFIAAVLSHFRDQEEDQPMFNMRRVVSLGRRCPETVADDVVMCLAEQVDVKKLFVYAVLPATAAVLMLMTHRDVYLFALADGLYIWSLAYAVWTIKWEESICRDDVWWNVGPVLAVSFLIAMGVNGYIIYAHYHDAQNVPSIYRYDVQGFLSIVNLLPTLLAYSAVSVALWPNDPYIFITKTYVQDAYTAYKRFVEDLGDECQPEHASPPESFSCLSYCQSRPTSPPGSFSCCQLQYPLHPEYVRLKRIICDNDLKVAEEVPENYPLIMASYYSIIYRRDLELMRRLMEILRNRNLDEKERAALQILEVVYEAASSPCGGQEALRRYVEKLSGINAPGWSFILKILAYIHLGYADPSYIAVVRRGILRTIDKCSGDNLSIYYFALSAIDRIKPLCERHF